MNQLSRALVCAALERADDAAKHVAAGQSGLERLEQEVAVSTSPLEWRTLVFCRTLEREAIKAVDIAMKKTTEWVTVSRIMRDSHNSLEIIRYTQ